MKNQSRFVSVGQFFLASVCLFISLLDFESALFSDGLENNFLADNRGIPLVILLTIIFGLGWWFESFIEHLVLSKGRKIAVLAIFGLIFVFVALGFGSLVFPPLGFLRNAMSASGYILMSGFFFRFSVARPEIIAKLQ